MSQNLFILGSNDTFPLAIGDFVQACGGTDATILFLLPGGELRGKLIVGYSQHLQTVGAGNCHFIAPDEQGEFDVPAVTHKLAEARGIIIGGGPSNDYYRLYAKEPFYGLVRRSYENGIPVMGCCGGSLILSGVYPLYQENGGPLECRPGLGLLQNHIIGIHFIEQNGLHYMVDDMAKTRTANGIGLDVKSYAVFLDGLLCKAVGSVHAVNMTNFDSKEYTIRKITP